MVPPALVAVAHGSRDPRSAATIDALAAEVRRQCRFHPAGSASERPPGRSHPAGSAGDRPPGRSHPAGFADAPPPGPDLDVRVSFLDLSAPRLGDVLDGVAADGHRRAVVVPLLLGDAFHARSDVPGLVSAAAARNPLLRIDTSDVLGPDPGTDAAALSRLREALVASRPDVAGGPPTSQGPRGLRGPEIPCEDGDGTRGGVRGPGTLGGDPLRDAELGVVLASVGSSRADANRVVADRVAGWRERFGWAAASAAYVTAAEPTPSRAIDAVRAAGARRVAVVPWVLAPGRLPDRIESAAVDGGALVVDPIGPHPDLAAAVLRRWAAAVRPATDVRHVS